MINKKSKSLRNKNRKCNKLSKKNRIKKGGSAGYKPRKSRIRFVVKNPPSYDEVLLCNDQIVSEAMIHQIDDYNEIISTIRSLSYEYPIMNASNTYPLVTNGNYKYEENLADGNCFYYSVIRSMERNIYPGRNPLDPNLEQGDFNGNHLLTPEGIRKFKEHIREHSRENTELMDTPIVNPTSGALQNLMDDTVFGENLASQATANYLNCCIFVLVPKGTNLGAGFFSNSDSWSVYYPDTPYSPSRPVNFGTEDDPVVLPSRDGETPSHLSLTNDFSRDELVYTKQKFGQICVHEDYLEKKETFRNTRKEQAIKDFIEARRICRNQIFIMNKDNGHFVSIEPNDHSKQNNFLLKPYYDILIEETSSLRLSSPRVSTSNSTIKTKSNSKKNKIKFTVKPKSGLSNTDITSIKTTLKNRGVKIDNKSLTQMLNAYSTKEEALRTLLFG
jgi:hypothetical protein